MYHPKIIAFACQWCTYAGADLAGLSRLPCPASVRVIMIPCTGRLDASLIIRAFLQGADGVMVSGCHPGDCHYGTGNDRARRRWALLRALLDTLGFDLRRLKFTWISASEGQKWAQLTHKFTEELTALGPATELASLYAESDCSDTASNDVRHFASEMSDILTPNVRATVPAQLPPALQRALSAALEAGQLTQIGGWRCRPTLRCLYPAWVTSTHELSALRCPAPRTNIARLLKEAPPASGERWGLVVRPQELASLNVLAQENALDPALMTAFLINQEGEYMGQGTLAELSQGLETQTLAEGWGATSPAARERLARWRQRPRAERFAFWREAAQRCLRCYACRQACPLCSCQQCFAEDNQPQLFPTASTAAGNWPWLALRALHLAGRCVGCGACARACPAGLPLDLLHTALAQTVQDEFGYRTGVAPTATPFQADFSRDDPQAFVE